MKLTSLLLKSLLFLGLAVATISAMVYFGLLDLKGLAAAMAHGRRWLLFAFALGLAATAVNLWRYAKILELLQVFLPFPSVAAATSVSLFVGQWMPGSMAVSEMVRLGLMVGASKLAKAPPHHSVAACLDTSQSATTDGLHSANVKVSGAKARIFVASFLDRACGLVMFMTVGTAGCLIALAPETAGAGSTLRAHELSLLGGLAACGLAGVAALMAVPWLAKHPAVLRTLESQSGRWLATSGAASRTFGQVMGALRRVTTPLASPDFSYSGFFKSLAISAVSSLSLVGLFWACSKAAGFPMSYLQVAAVFPFLAIAQLLPIGFGGIGGHQLVAIALFQAFSLEAKGVATVSLLAGVVSLVLNAVIGMLFLRTSANQVRAILQRADPSLDDSLGGETPDTPRDR